ncbi:hypothetical protein KVR01_000476 [Diaporthe batatas]|uniref:uncharacterized protein n=1 Tax=Diaporthe batatas TaxID=748121 RepID=UPI001D05513F|nr:uncharacterized protein KVR01_000476 [Diaporthe batatas]KAG8169731.1 hypothetical protein KVR01_000476 [Diaporthe batatas]
MDDTHPTTLNSIIHGVEAVALAGKPMNVSDLPLEILDKIMFHLSKRAEKRNGGAMKVGVTFTPSADIKNVRLSCHILSAAASRYLIDGLKVQVSQSSLSHLEEISEHPLIRHSVQGVELCLAQHDSIFDNGIQGLIQFVKSNKMLLDIADYGNSHEMTRKARYISACWNEFQMVLESAADTLLGSFDEEIGAIQDIAGCIHHTGTLLEGFRQYRSRLHEQTSLHQGGFVARVSAAMAKLPSVEHLGITDWDTAALGRRPGEFDMRVYKIDVSSDLSITNSLAGSRLPFDQVRGTNLMSIIPGLVCTGKNIESLDIQISPSAVSYTELMFSTSQQAELRSGLKKLQSFKFDNYRAHIANLWNEADAIRPLGQFIDSCLISDNLECILINAKIRYYPNVARSLFSPRAWPKLKSVDLKDLPVSAADLDVLTKSLASNHPYGYLTLRAVRLYCGATWASILDMLRSRDLHVSLGMYQFGAEAEEDPALCEEVFSGLRWRYTRSFPSFAEYYVRGEDMKNPLLERPDQDLCHRMFGQVLEHRLPLWEF